MFYLRNVLKNTWARESISNLSSRAHSMYLRDRTSVTSDSLFDVKKHFSFYTTEKNSTQNKTKQNNTKQTKQQKCEKIICILMEIKGMTLCNRIDPVFDIWIF